MPIPILPQSQFNGEVFVSNFRAVYNRLEVPSVRLDASHPFRQLWHSHLQSLTQKGGLFEGVIDCLAAILLGDPCWKEATPAAVSQTQSDIRSLLICMPPNIVITSHLNDYACHVRCSALWNFICISKGYVKLWADADKRKQKLGLTALLITSIDHEMGHWAQSIKNGLCYLPVSPSSRISEYDLTSTSDLSSDDDDDDSSSDGSKVSSSDSTEVSSPIGSTFNEAEFSPFHGTGTNVAMTTISDTPKAFQAPWTEGKAGEAGEFLEISTRGGIMEYDHLNKRVYLVVGEGISCFPTESYLELYERNEGPSTSLFFHSDSRKSSSFSGFKTKDASAKFPFEGVDGCPSTRLYSIHRRNRRHIPTKVLKL